MANFWAGVGQGFSQGFEKSWDAAARRRERKEDREQALKDAATRKKDAQEIAERARQNKLTDLKMQLEREAIKERQGQEAILESLSPEARKKALGDRLLFTGLQPETPAMLKGLDMGEVGRLDKYDTMTPSELQGAGLAGQRIEKELLAERVAEKAAERALEAETEKNLNEIKNEIAEFEGRLGITTGGTPTGGEPDIRRYHGELKEEVDDLDAMRPTYQAPTKQTQDDRDNETLQDLSKEFDTATPERRLQIIRQGQLIFSTRQDPMPTAEAVQSFFESGKPPEQGEPVIPFKETAEERAQREKRLSMLKNMDDLLQTAEKQDWTGLVPGLTSEFFDKILPSAGIDKFANIKRLRFRSELGANAYAMARELLEESRMTNEDFRHLRRYTPEEWMEKPEVLAKLRSLNELVRAKLMIQDKRAGKAPLFSLSPVEFFNQMDVPNEKFGGAITVPSEIAPAVIRNSLNFRYIKGNEAYPVTAKYIQQLYKDNKLSRDNAALWIHELGLKYK